MIRRIAVFLACASVGAFAWTDVSPVNTFVDSGIIYASDHNENDSALASGINELEDTLDTYYMRWTDVEDGDSTVQYLNVDTIRSYPDIDSIQGGVLWETIDLNVTDSLFADTMTSNNVDINGGAIDGTVIGADSAAAGTFSTGTITTVDINGGAIDSTVIGANSAAAGTFTTGTMDTGTLTVGTITTADINGGTIDGTTIGQASADSGAFTTLQSTRCLAGQAALRHDGGQKEISGDTLYLGADSLSGSIFRVAAEGGSGNDTIAAIHPTDVMAEDGGSYYYPMIWLTGWNGGDIITILDGNNIEASASDVTFSRSDWVCLINFIDEWHVVSATDNDD